MSTLAQRLEAVGRTPEELAERAADFSMTPEEVLERWEQAFQSADPLAHANDALGLEGEDRLTAFVDDGDRYAFVGRRGRRSVTDNQWTEYRQARPKIEGAVGVVLRPMAARQWERVRTLLLLSKTVEEIGDLATDRGLGREWLRLYLDGRSLAEAEDPTEGPYEKDGATWVPGSDLRRWLRSTQSEVVDHKRLGRVLRAAGCTAARHHRGKTTRSVWSVPEDLDDDHAL